MRAYPYMPGVPAAGHITSGGHWHPGTISNCTKCNDWCKCGCNRTQLCTCATECAGTSHRKGKK